MAKAGSCVPCSKKKCEAAIGPYDEVNKKCDGQAHHVPPDHMKRIGSRPKPSEFAAKTRDKKYRIGGTKGGQSFLKGTSICLEGDAADKTSEHGIAHKCDKILYRRAARSTPKGTVSLQEVIDWSVAAAAKAKPECKKELIAAVNKEYEGVDRSMRMRGVRLPASLSKEAKGALGKAVKIERS